MPYDGNGIQCNDYNSYNLWHMKRLCSTMTLEQLQRVAEHVQANQVLLSKIVENQAVLDYLNKQIELKKGE